MRDLRFALLFLTFCFLSFCSFARIDDSGSENNTNVDNSLIIARINNDDIEVSIPLLIFSFTETEIKVKFKNTEHTRLLFNKNKINFIINGEEKQLTFIHGEASFKKKFNEDNVLTIFTEEFSYNHPVIVFSFWAVLLPIVLIIGLILFWMMKRK